MFGTYNTSNPIFAKKRSKSAAWSRMYLHSGPKKEPTIGLNYFIVRWPENDLKIADIARPAMGMIPDTKHPSNDRNSEVTIIHPEIRRPLPSLGLGGAAPGITAGVPHLQTFSVPGPPANFKPSAAALGTHAKAARLQPRPLTVSIQFRPCYVARFKKLLMSQTLCCTF